MERIETPERLTNGHIARYRLAAGYIEGGDRVVDAACGIGYGAMYLQAAPHVRYVGVDKSLVGVDAPTWNGTGRSFDRVDLEEWEPDFAFDVAVSFETIEHLEDYSTMVHWMCKAGRWIICSVPVVPTVGINPWHRHDFEVGELPELFDGWELFQSFLQPQEKSEVYILRREI